MPTIYIAGPMTGLRGFNADSFNMAALWLENQGYEVRNPACLGVKWGNYEDYMEVDLVMLSQCDNIVLLPGGDQSPGANRELEFAKANGIGRRWSLLTPLWPVLTDMYRENGGTA